MDTHLCGFARSLLGLWSLFDATAAAIIRCSQYEVVCPDRLYLAPVEVQKKDQVNSEGPWYGVGYWSEIKMKSEVCREQGSIRSESGLSRGRYETATLSWTHSFRMEQKPVLRPLFPRSRQQSE